MGRQKVTNENRQRTAQACAPCKRRKQKCNGNYPCTSCVKGSFKCEYAANSGHSGAAIQRDQSSTSANPQNVDNSMDLVALEGSKGPVPYASVASPTSRAPWSNMVMTQYGPQEPGLPISNQYQINQQPAVISLSPLEQHPLFPDKKSDLEEKVEVRGEIRWLQDPTGRLLYMGEASSLSFLQVVRTEVGIAMESSPSILGSNFAEDKLRHTIPDTKLLATRKGSVPFSMPDRLVAKAIADSFFTSTCGLVEILDRSSFDMSLESYYTDPSSVWESNLCLLYLVLANGLVLAIPSQSTQTFDLLNSMVTDPSDYADMFFQSGKWVGEKVPGFEDGDIWSIQARVLMALYKFLISKWNASYDYLGSAVSTACSLGFHRTEFADLVASQDKMRLALWRHLWRSIFVLDRIVCEFVDRPPAIRETDFSETLLQPPPLEGIETSNIERTQLAALDAVVKAVQALGHITKKFSVKSTITARLGQETLDECLERMRVLPPCLNSFRFVHEQLSPDEGLSILYVNLLETHCKLLSTRPYFLHLFISLLHSKNRVDPSLRPLTTIEGLSQSCLEVSMRAVTMMYNAYRSNWLPRRNAFILNFLFASSMIIMCNELVGMYRNEQYTEVVDNALAMAADFAGPDAQGQRVWTTLSSFGAFVQEQRLARFALQPYAESQRPPSQPSPSSSASNFVSHGSHMALHSVAQHPGHVPTNLVIASRSSGGSNTTNSPAATYAMAGGAQPRTPALEASSSSTLIGVPAHRFDSPPSASSTGPSPYSVPQWAAAAAAHGAQGELGHQGPTTAGYAGARADVSPHYILPAQGPSDQLRQQPSGYFSTFYVSKEED